MKPRAGFTLVEVMISLMIFAMLAAAGYAFAAFDGARWSALDEGPFGPETWTAGTTVAPAAPPARIVFDPTGVADPAGLTLTRDRHSRTITVDGAGEVTLNG